MARISDAGIIDGLEMVEHEFDAESVAGKWLTRSLLDLSDCRSILNNLLARMEDKYDGAPDAVNEMVFTGGDIADIRRVVG